LNIEATENHVYILFLLEDLTMLIYEVTCNRPKVVTSTECYSKDSPYTELSKPGLDWIFITRDDLEIRMFKRLS